MSEEKKLTPEELNTIKELQSQYNKFVFELGSIEAQLADITAHKVLIEEEKNNVLGDIRKLGEKEKELLASLQAQYGIGNIDIETGLITPF
jgi:hypothetical protein